MNMEGDGARGVMMTGFSVSVLFLRAPKKWTGEGRSDGF
jgi:hypothetical protein